MKKHKFFIFLILVFLFSGCGSEIEKDKSDVKRAGDLYHQPESTEKESEQSLIETFNFKEYSEDGSKLWEVSASRATIYKTVVKLTDVVGIAYGEEANVEIKADKGKYDKVSQNIYLNQNVEATTSDGTTMLTDKLIWKAKAKEGITDRYVIVRDKKLQVNGKGARTRLDLKRIEFEKEIMTTVEPDTVIICDGPLEVDYGKRIAVFKNNVIAEDSRGKIRADEMVVYFNESKKIEKIVAKGEVKIIRGNDITTSQRAEYVAKENKVILTGKPKLLIYPEKEEQIPKPLSADRPRTTK